MFRCLQTKKAPPARLYCLIDGAKILTSNRSTPILHLYYMYTTCFPHSSCKGKNTLFAVEYFLVFPLQFVEDTRLLLIGYTA